MRVLLILAYSAFRETVRDKVLYNLGLFAIGLILFSLILGDWAVFARETVIKDFNFGCDGLKWINDIHLYWDWFSSKRNTKTNGADFVGKADIKMAICIREVFGLAYGFGGEFNGHDPSFLFCLMGYREQS